MPLTGLEFCWAHKYRQINGSGASPLVYGLAAFSFLATQSMWQWKWAVTFFLFTEGINKLSVQLALTSWEHGCSDVVSAGTSQADKCVRMLLAFAAWTKQMCAALFNLFSSANPQLVPLQVLACLAAGDCRQLKTRSQIWGSHSLDLWEVELILGTIWKTGSKKRLISGRCLSRTPCALFFFFLSFVHMLSQLLWLCKSSDLMQATSCLHLSFLVSVQLCMCLGYAGLPSGSCLRHDGRQLRATWPGTCMHKEIHLKYFWFIKYEEGFKLYLSQ